MPLAPPDPEFAARLPIDAARILVIGSVALAAQLRARNPASLVREATSLPAEGRFEAIALVDWLARQPRTEATLAHLVHLLVPDGVLLADVPNAEHWRFAARLLTGGWDQAEHGPGDAGDLRLFAIDATRRALETAGLTPLDALPRDLDGEGAEAFVARIAPGLAAIGVDPAQYRRRASARRLLWRASLGAPRKLTIVAQTLRPVGGVNDVRVHMPLAGLATHPGVEIRAGQTPSLEGIGDTPRVLILQRRLLDNAEAPAHVARLRARGFVVVQEFDDDPAHWPGIAASGHFAFSGVHAVQTSTPALADLLRQFNPEVAVFPNVVEALPEPANFRDPARLRVFLGALRREADFAPLLPALNALLPEAGDRLMLEVVFDRATHDALATPHKRFHPLLPYAAYRALMAGCEVALLPLRDTRFNGFKSDLKYVEAGAHRLACIASPVVYGATIRDGDTGRIATTPDAFAEALRGFLAAPETALRMGGAARADVARHRMLAGQIGARRAWYDSLWERRAALDEALVARAPRVVHPQLFG
jgi:glycosyltransferase involved in cell wall biosynthesis